MKRGRVLGPLLGSLLFLPVGIFFLIDGELAVGLICVSLGTAGILGAGVKRMSRGSSGLRRSLGSVRHSGQDTMATTFEPSHGRVVLLGAATLSLLGLGLGLALQDDDPVARVVGWVFIVLFSPITIGTAAHLIRRRRSSLLPDGVLWRTVVGTLWIPWSAIDELSITKLRGYPFIALRLDQLAGVKGGRRIALLSWLDRRIAGFDLTLPLHMIDSSPERVAALLRHYLEHPDDRVELGTPASLHRMT